MSERVDNVGGCVIPFDALDADGIAGHINKLMDGCDTTIKNDQGLDAINYIIEHTWLRKQCE